MLKEQRNAIAQMTGMLRKLSYRVHLNGVLSVAKLWGSCLVLSRMAGHDNAPGTEAFQFTI